MKVQYSSGRAGPNLFGARNLDLSGRFIFGFVDIFTLIFSAATVVLALQHLNMPAGSENLWSLFTQLFVAFWVYLDRRDRHLSLPFDFDAFVFFAWPLVLPYYLYKSRGARRGILLTAFVFTLVLAPKLVASVLRLYR